MTATIVCSKHKGNAGYVEIRREQPEDHREIHQLTRASFTGRSNSDGSEPAIIDILRSAGDLVLSLVAFKSGALVGHVAFSPVRIGIHTSGWYGLGPVSVRPDLQRKGIGSALIIEGLAIVENMVADGCALIGDRAYYRRFGFIADGRIQYSDLPNENEFVQWKSFGKKRPEGLLVFCTAFDTQTIPEDRGDLNP